MSCPLQTILNEALILNISGMFKTNNRILNYFRKDIPLIIAPLLLLFLRDFNGNEMKQTFPNV